jgi:hypothetical protein
MILRINRKSGSEVLTAMVIKITIFWDIMSYSSLKVNHFEGTYHLRVAEALLATCFMLVSCSAYSSTLKMKAIFSSEMSLDFQWTILHHIPGDSTLQT